MSNNRQRGKNTERKLAKLTNSKRVGILQGEDLEHKLWSIEVKDRVKFAGEKFMLQAERNCPQGKTALAIVHITGQRHDNDIVMIRFRDWIDLHGE